MFFNVYGSECEKQKSNLQQNKDPARVYSIVNASKQYNDGIHLWLEPKLKEDDNIKLSYHKSCVSKYTSKTNIKTKASPEIDIQLEIPAKRSRSSLAVFDFIKHCLYCGEDCILQKDPKTPSRWRPAYLCRSTESEFERRPYKQFLIEKCEASGDGWGNEVGYGWRGV